MKFLGNFFQVCCHFGAPKDGPGAAQGAPRPAQGAPGRPRGRPGAADATPKTPKSSPKRSQEQLGGRPRSKSTFEVISGSIFIGLATENRLRIEREFLKKLRRKCRRRTLRICVSTEPARAELTSAKRRARQTNAEIERENPQKALQNSPFRRRRFATDFDTKIHQKYPRNR